MLLPIANNAYFVVTTRKFSNEIRFLVEPLCCNRYILSRTSPLVYCAQCSARYMLSNICSWSKRWDYINKPFYQTHQILPAINENALTAFHEIRCLSCSRWTAVHYAQLKHEPRKTWSSFKHIYRCQQQTQERRKGHCWLVPTYIVFSRSMVGLGMAVLHAKCIRRERLVKVRGLLGQHATEIV